MHFLIQNDPIGVDRVQMEILLEVLRHNKYDHSYELIDFDGFFKEEKEFEFGASAFRAKAADEFPAYYKNAIPFGTIEFTTRWLQTFKGIEREIPIEIPPCLRQERFLKRKYNIVSVDQVPRKGDFFVKDASQAKWLKYKGDLEYQLNDEMFAPPISSRDNSIRFLSDHLYQVSEIVPIKAEYRVYIVNQKIEAICLYDGDPMVLPDVELVREAHRIYSHQPDCPRSYSMDLMVNNRGTSIIEMHTFTCLGLYSVLWDENLLYALRDGIRYVEEYNTPQTVFICDW